MPKRAIMLLTAVSLAMPVASAAYAQDITVTAPRHRERSSTTGAPIETVTTSRVVNTADLDLRTDAGMKALRGRVEEAARKACAWLDQVYPLTADDSPPCVKTAVDKAMADAQALAAR